MSSWVERTAVESAERVIAVSEVMGKDVLAHFAVDPARVRVVHNGIDLGRYCEEARQAFGPDC